MESTWITLLNKLISATNYTKMTISYWTKSLIEKYNRIKDTPNKPNNIYHSHIELTKSEFEYANLANLAYFPNEFLNK